MLKSEKIKIPVYRPSIGEKEKRYVAECMDSTWISSKGRFIRDFEDSFSQYLEINSSTTVSNGTVALHLALLALGIGPDDEVIVPTFTYIASVNAIKYVGAKPVFADSESHTWNIDPNDIRKKITPKTKAIMVVHLYGNPCKMDEIKEICGEFNIDLIEDAAEALGSKYKGEYIGTFGDISTFSFFGNKTLTTGEGGMVASPNKDLIERVSFLKNQGVSKEIEYWHDEIAFNYRMTNIAAAIGLAQLERIDEILLKKIEIADLYSLSLSNTPVEFQFTEDNCINSNWMVSILLPNKKVREEIRHSLRKSGIETRPFFNPVHKMPPYNKNQVFSVAEDLGSRGINLPSYPDLDDQDIDMIASIVKEYFS